MLKEKGPKRKPGPKSKGALRFSRLAKLALGEYTDRIDEKLAHIELEQRYKEAIQLLKEFSKALKLAHNKIRLAESEARVSMINEEITRIGLERTLEQAGSNRTMLKTLERVVQRFEGGPDFKSVVEVRNLIIAREYNTAKKEKAIKTARALDSKSWILDQDPLLERWGEHTFTGALNGQNKKKVINLFTRPARRYLHKMTS